MHEIRQCYCLSNKTKLKREMFMICIGKRERQYEHMFTTIISAMATVPRPPLSNKSNKEVFDCQNKVYMIIKKKTAHKHRFKKKKKKDHYDSPCILVVCSYQMHPRVLLVVAMKWSFHQIQILHSPFLLLEN